MSQPTGQPDTPTGLIGGARSAIARNARALLPSSPSLFYQFLQEQLGQHGSQIKSIEATLEYHRKKAFCAATRLLSLGHSKAEVPQDEKFASAVSEERLS